MHPDDPGAAHAGPFGGADHFEVYGVTGAKLVGRSANSVAYSRGFQQGCAKFLGVRRGKPERGDVRCGVIDALGVGATCIRHPTDN